MCEDPIGRFFQLLLGPKTSDIKTNSSSLSSRQMKYERSQTSIVSIVIRISHQLHLEQIMKESNIYF